MKVAAACAAVAVLLSAACRKSEWTADEVVAEFRAYGLPTRSARPPSTNECPAAPAGSVGVRRFDADVPGESSWGCIFQFEGESAARAAHTELRARERVGTASHRANVVLVLSDDFESAAAGGYTKAVQSMWGGE